MSSALLPAPCPTRRLWRAALATAGCVLGALSVTAQAGSPTRSLREFRLPSPRSVPNGIALGPDRALWFTETGRDRIGRITTGGKVTEFALPNTTGDAIDIVAGPDGAMWFTEGDGHKVGRITMSGMITEFALSSTSIPSSIVASRDGGLWFTDVGDNSVRRISITGEVTSVAIPVRQGRPGDIVESADRNLWFTLKPYDARGSVARLQPNGTMTRFQVEASSLAVARDQSVWFTFAGRPGGVGRIASDGEVRRYPLSGTPNAKPRDPRALTLGPDGALWFVERGDETSPVDARIGQITPAGKIAEFRIPTSSSGPSAITAGPLRDLWFTETLSNRIGRITVRAAPDIFGEQALQVPASRCASDSGTTVRIRVAASGRVAARVQYSGLRVASISGRSRHAGSAALRLRLTPAGRAQLARLRGRRMPVRGTLTEPSNQVRRIEATLVCG